MAKQNKLTVAIIILHFGSWHNTKECLDSLTKIIHPSFNYQVYLVNNSLKRIPNHKIVFKKIIPQKNLGFAEGNNFAIKKALETNPDYFLFLNNDTIVEKNFLQNLLVHLPNPDCFAGPILEHQVNGKTYFDYGGFINWKKGQPKHFNKTKYKTTHSYIKRDFVSGCCLLASSQIIKQIGAFRKDYFLYLEDVELCIRARKHNYKTYLIPSAKIFHKGSQSSSEFNKIFYSLKNSLKFSWQYCPARYKLIAILFNLYFYPTLLIHWQLKHLLSKLE